MKTKLMLVLGSMLVSIAAYTYLYGLTFAIGLVALIAAHESGHFLAARLRGIPTTLPMFIPFVGAFISIKGTLRSAREEAYIALAGPVTGTLASFGLYVASKEAHSIFLESLAYVGFFINLLNLFPTLPLDGGRVVGALHPAIWGLGLVGLAAYDALIASPLITAIIVLGVIELATRWSRRKTPQFRQFHKVRPAERLLIATLYLGLILFLVVYTAAAYIPRPL